MHTRYLPLAALSLGLAACGSDTPDSSDGETISMEEVADRAESSAIKPEPGKYSLTMEVLEIDIPGAPPEAAEMMRGMMSQQSQDYCLTQEDVDQGFEQMARQGQDENCTFERFDISGGEIDAKMSCDIPGQGTMTMTMDGSATATSSVMDMTMQGNMTGMGESTIRMKASHERIGDCG
ncbi:DUF3617 domain-containing protein [Altererythrobacter lutimaris]|uniref:DUF3617 domain-containing protein n=1 Tax=Altererythrobacter lutimaris TaxID=2743979 RepID=A0A850HG25_9SPHN|nr:DUF3617 domain-containing protein [Altererythrobacter lutimaris]NVE93532.1 DUF3617 domain-containing protein [Altererythrobacter lutimaris]